MLSTIASFFLPNDPLAKQIKHLTGVNPRKAELYRLALTHSSKQSKSGFNNERLELLGDSVLSLIVSDYLFSKYPLKDEGYLTEMRSKIVNRTQLNELALNLGLDQLIVSNLNRKSLEQGSALGNAFEAFIGALYIDRGFKKTKKFLVRRVLPVYFNTDALENKVTNFKSVIINHAQKQGLEYQFQLMEEMMAGNARRFKMGFYLNGQLISTGTDFTKKKAEQLAAAEACKQLDLV